MKAGDVILVALPQGDGRVKLRPALLLRQLPGFGDWLVCGISTQLRHAISGFDEIIQIGDEDFAASGLLSDSLIRLSYLAVVPANQIPGTIGCVTPQRLTRLVRHLSDYLVAPAT